MPLNSRIVSFCVAAMIGTIPVSANADAHAAQYDIRAFGDLEFVLFGEGPLEMSVLWGDPTAGASGYLLRIPAGFEAPIHSHTANYRAIVLEGQALHWLAEEDSTAAAPMGVGGYWLQPGGQLHGDANVSDGANLALIIFDGPVDFLVPE